MKQLLLLPVTLLIIGACETGCQKEVSPYVLRDSTNNTISILRQIKIVSTSATNPFNFVFSIQYDTANRKINFYKDDTATSNPYDQLMYAYQFNSNGYLIGAVALDTNGVVSPDFTIQRNSSDEIQNIIEFNVEELNGTPYNDTVFYSYVAMGNQTRVQDSVRFQGQSGFSTAKSIFNAQNKLVSVNYFFNGFADRNENYFYNAQGDVTKILTDVDTTEFTYDNITPPNWQNMPLLFLGKDYYLLQQEALTNRLNYQFLTVVIESLFETIYNPLLTNPLKQIIRQGQSPFNPGSYQSKTVNFINSFSSTNLLNSVSILPIGDDPIYFSFKYQ